MSRTVSKQVDIVKEHTVLPDWTIQEVSDGFVNNVEISLPADDGKLPRAVIEIIGEGTKGEFVVELSLRAASTHGILSSRVGMVTIEGLLHATQAAERIAHNIEKFETWADRRNQSFEEVVEAVRM